MKELFIKNPDKEYTDSIEKALLDGKGQCPCVPKNAQSDDTKCPCTKFRRGFGCHCRLYIRQGEQ